MEKEIWTQHNRNSGRAEMARSFIGCDIKYIAKYLFQDAPQVNVKTFKEKQTINILIILTSHSTIFRHTGYDSYPCIGERGDSAHIGKIGDCFRVDNL